MVNLIGPRAEAYGRLVWHAWTLGTWPARYVPAATARRYADAVDAHESAVRHEMRRAIGERLRGLAVRLASL